MEKYRDWLVIPVLASIFVAWSASLGPCEESQVATDQPQLCEKLAQALAKEPLGPIRAWDSEPVGSPRYEAGKELQERRAEAERAIEQVHAQMASEGVFCFCSGNPPNCRVAQPREVQLCKKVRRVFKADEEARAGVPMLSPHGAPGVAVPIGVSKDRQERIEEADRKLEKARAETAAEGIDCEDFEPLE